MIKLFNIFKKKKVVEEEREAKPFIPPTTILEHEKVAEKVKEILKGFNLGSKAYIQSVVDVKFTLDSNTIRLTSLLPNYSGNVGHITASDMTLNGSCIVSVEIIGDKSIIIDLEFTEVTYNPYSELEINLDSLV